MIEGIDKELVDIIEFANANGIKTFASCDGVLEEHEIEFKKIYGDDFERRIKECPETTLRAYISMLDNDIIIPLLANALDNDFTVEISSADDYEIYGNKVEGRTYAIRYLNLYNENTNIIEKIFKETVNGQMIPSVLNKERIEKIVNAISHDMEDFTYKLRLNDKNGFNIDTDNHGKYDLLYICPLAHNNKGIIINEVVELLRKEIGLTIYTNEDNLTNTDRSYFYYSKNRKTIGRAILRDYSTEDIIKIIELLKTNKFTICE